MKRIVAALAVTLALAACGGAAEQGEKKKERELRPLDPNPPMSAGDIDSIVKETRERDASQGAGAPAPAADNASNTTN